MLLLGLMLLLLVPRWVPARHEGFSQLGSSIEVYDNASTHNDFIAKYDTKMKEGILSDRDRLLHMRGCYQIEHTPDRNILVSMINASNDASMKVERLGPLYTNSFNEVEVKIQENVVKVCNQLRSITKNPNAMIAGEVYVLVMQAPYYKSSKGEMMAIQYNIPDYSYMPVNLGSGTSVQDAIATPLDFEVFVIYANYKKNMTLRSTPYAIDVTLMQYRTKHDQCKITCAKNQNLICGCKTGDTPQQHYKSSCVTSRLGATTMEDKNKAIPHDFPILYVINRQNDTVLNLISQVPPSRT